MSTPPTVAEIYGPMFIGTFLSTILYGVVVVQTFIYFQMCKRDYLWMRCFIVYLFVAETVSTGLFFGMMYEPLLLNFGNPEVLVKSPLRSSYIFVSSSENLPILSLHLHQYSVPVCNKNPVVEPSFDTVLISTPAQWFMAWRIKVITGSKIIAVSIFGLSLASLTGGIWTGIAVGFTPEFQRFGEFKYAPSLWLVTTTVADIMIASSLVYVLASILKHKTRFSATNDQIDRIIRLTVQTGTITAVAALADAVVYLSVTSHPTIFFIWDLSLSKLYTNSVLSSLNARRMSRISGRPGGAPTSVLFASNELGSSGSRSGNSRPSRSNDMEMAVQSEGSNDLDSFKFDHESSIPPPPAARVAYSISSVSRRDERTT
ncbi:hypothetical protein Moror_9206 [Moniliophthora roreri MCA 2997]|uniref:DUF6534 domain-containing protein n=1 Tax=Moniliophthora roreri (strain MCA 2997) TaxID=1381753 RepID=V2WXM9_MONRO|nr:hypothetical protein Moror_9206 [Moniliophthora roreri MCA 2997]